MTVDSNVLQLWFHYESTAMHFNELLINYRTTVMGGTGILISVASFYQGRTEPHDDQIKQSIARGKLLWSRAWISLAITVLFICAVVIDLCYYNKLLEGAVQAILELENKHEDLTLSTTISCQFHDNFDFCMKNLKAPFPVESTPVRTVYLVLIALLFSITCFAFWKLREQSKSLESLRRQ